MLRYLRGTAEIEVTGAAFALCLNRWTAADLPFWRLERTSELVFRCRVYEGQLPRLRREAARAWCELRVLRRYGLPTLLRRLRPRPILAVGMAAAVLLAFFLQSFVWFLQIEGNERLTNDELLRALSEEGVRFGTWGPSLDSEHLKNRMLLRVPELRWLAVNREGGVLHVLVAEREEEKPILEEAGVANVVASRPGVIREIHVHNGFSDKEPGDLVLEGEVLISGVAEWTTHIQATRARGEVYAETLRINLLAAPSEALEKRYTGRTETCVTLIFERKRRKISGNSGIFGTMCDRMIETTALTLPGGYELPLVLETETLSEYRLEPRALPEEEARSLLEAEALRQTRAEMVAGSVEDGSLTIQKTQDSYRCRGVWNCLEVISRTVPAELFREEERNGETDQRRTD